MTEDKTYKVVAINIDDLDEIIDITKNLEAMAWDPSINLRAFEIEVDELLYEVSELKKKLGAISLETAE